MTLTDINDLQKELPGCKSSKDILLKLEECGEDCDEKAAEMICKHLTNADGGFSVKNGEAFFDGKQIRCSKCGNAFPEKILGSASELLSRRIDLHFGCCECGEQFIIN